jgi:hypothetical protein
MESHRRLKAKLTIARLEVSTKDALKILNEAQYAHLLDVEDASLPYFGTPTATASLTINKENDGVWTYMETGGPLGNIAIRGYFGVPSGRHEVVIAGYEKIQHQGGPKPHVLLKIVNRLDHYATLCA